MSAALKPGDRVFVGPLVLDDDCEASWYDGDDERCATTENSIPDSPQLANVARLLAAEPGITAAVWMLHLHVDNAFNQWPSPYNDNMDDWDRDSALLAKLSAALGGES